jgi:hypothetical protein
MTTESRAKNAAKKPVRTKKKSVSKRAPKTLFALRGRAPTEPEVRVELTIFWDAFSPLNLAAINILYDKGKKLADIGVTQDDAESFVHKYNSIIMRAPGKGPLVSSPEAKKWLATTMRAIVDSVTKRSQP